VFAELVSLLATLSQRYKIAGVFFSGIIGNLRGLAAKKLENVFYWKVLSHEFV
jgi:hypothetical protein